MTEAPATRSAQRMTRVTWCVFVVGSVWLVADAIGLLGPLTVLTYPLLSLGSVVAIIVGVRVNRPTTRQPWILLTAGMFLFFVGGVTRTAMGTLGVITAQRSIVPDLITIPGYFFAAAGFFGSCTPANAAATARSTRCSTPRSSASRRWRSAGSSCSTPRSSSTRRCRYA